MINQEVLPWVDHSLHFNYSKCLKSKWITASWWNRLLHVFGYIQITFNMFNINLILYYKMFLSLFFWLYAGCPSWCNPHIFYVLGAATKDALHPVSEFVALAGKPIWACHMADEKPTPEPPIFTLYNYNL